MKMHSYYAVQKLDLMPFFDRWIYPFLFHWRPVPLPQEVKETEVPRQCSCCRRVLVVDHQNDICGECNHDEYC